MNTGKTLFAQLMDFLPWTTFTRIVDRYGGDHRVRTLSCAEQYRSMAFAQLTCRESLRDIETCLSFHASKLYHMGFRQPVRRSTLADANERRDWRIHAALAQRLITQARTLYVDEELGLDLTNTVYALDSTTIALCLSVFPWAHFRTTKAAVKMHTLLDLRGNIPSFIHISDGKLHDVHALDMLLPEAGAIYVVDRGYVDFARLYVLHQAGAFFVTRAKSNIDAHRVYSAPTDRSTGIICDQTISLDGFYTRQDYPELLRRIRFKDPESGKTLVFITNNFSLPAATICALYKSRWQVELFFKWIKQHLRIKQFHGTSENAVKTQIWIAVSVFCAEIVNFADDLCVLGKAPAAEMLTAVERLMGGLKLTVNEQKTRCLRCPEEPIEFLGYRIGRNYRPHGKGAYIGTRPGKASVQSICRKISEMTAPQHGWKSMEEMVEGLNRTMSGWANYFSLGQVSPAYNAVNRHTGKRLRQWLGRKHKTRAGRFVRYSEERLCADYSLLRLTRQTVAFPSAKA